MIHWSIILKYFLGQDFSYSGKWTDKKKLFLEQHNSEFQHVHVHVGLQVFQSKICGFE